MDNKTVRTIISIIINAVIITVGVYVIFTAGNKAYTFGHNIFNEEAMSTVENAREVEITIPEGVTPNQVAKLLYDKGLVEDEIIAYLQIMLSDYKDKFVAGTYQLDTSMKPTDMFMIISNSVEEE